MIIYGSRAEDYNASHNDKADIDLLLPSLSANENKIMLVRSYQALKDRGITGQMDAKFLPATLYDIFKAHYCEIVDGLPYITKTGDTLLKVAHLQWKGDKWNKHFKKLALNCERGYTNYDQDHYKQVYKYLEHEKGAKDRISLKKSSEEFFNHNVNRIIPHDLIHEMVAIHEQPLHETIKKDNEDVLVCKDKFAKMKYQDQIDLCREEIFTISLERYILPGISQRVVYDRFIDDSYKNALKAVVTSLSKGWFPKFILENSHKLYHNNVPFVGYFFDNLAKYERENSNENFRELITKYRSISQA